EANFVAGSLFQTQSPAYQYSRVLQHPASPQNDSSLSTVRPHRESLPHLCFPRFIVSRGVLSHRCLDDRLISGLPTLIPPLSGCKANFVADILSKNSHKLTSPLIYFNTQQLPNLATTYLQQDMIGMASFRKTKLKRIKEPP
ncbi:hypothetical protein H5410_064420, partial [Solanum commersonii]